MTNPFLCERCGGELESDDAVSIIEGVCCPCRSAKEHRRNIEAMSRQPAALDTPSQVSGEPLASDTAQASSPVVPLSVFDDLLASLDQDPPSGSGGRHAASHPQPAADGAPVDHFTEPSRGGPADRDDGENTARPPIEPAAFTSDAGLVAHDAPRASQPTPLDRAIMPVATPSPPRMAEREDGPPAGVPLVAVRARIEPPPPPAPLHPTAGRSSWRARRRARDLTIGATVGLLVTLCATVYLLRGRPPLGAPAMRQTSTADGISLRVHPPWARVTLGGRHIMPDDDRGKFLLPRPATDDPPRWLEVSADGCDTDRRAHAGLGGVDEVFVELVRRPYVITVQTDPPRADVWKNGERIGRSPISFSVAPEEKPTVTITRPGFLTVVRDVAPPAGQRLDLDITLEVAGPCLTIASDPPGADIALDGIRRGIAPLTVELDPSYLGSEVTVAAIAAGHLGAQSTVVLPDLDSSQGCFVRLVLERTPARIEVWTTPPGGRIIVEGRDLGPAPVVARFAPAQVGQTVVVQASLDGSYYGRQEVAVPPPRAPVRLTIPMKFNARRVAVILALPLGRPTDATALSDLAVDLIHGLTLRQRFAVLAQGRTHIETWPGGLATQAATSEQKVRAYNMIRSIRPSADRDLLGMLQKALEFRPTTIWLLAGDGLDRDRLLQFNDWAQGQDVSIHVVTTRPRAQDDWLERWAAGHSGTLTVLGRDPSPETRQLTAIEGDP